MVSQEHRALQLTLIDEDSQQQLIKLPPYLQTEDETISAKLQSIRSNWKYIYVIQWLYSLRSIVKLAGDNFDVDLFEEELLGINYQSINQETTFLNKLKMNLISVLQGTKINKSKDFENVYRLWFGYETPLKGNPPKEEEEEEEEKEQSTDQDGQDDQMVIDLDPEEEITFDQLSLPDKIEILYSIMEYLTTYPQFRSQIDKFTNSSESRVAPIYKLSKNEDLLLLDDNRLYKRTSKFPKMKIPKKLKDSSKDPESEYKIEPTLNYECLTVGIYKFEEFVLSNKKNKKLYSILCERYYNVALSDIKRRKQILNRKKEIQLQNLLATRKRSSRLEEKEKRKQEDEERQREEEEIYLREASNRRASNRLRAKDDGKRSRESTDELSREDRLKMRRGDVVEVDPFEVENSVVNGENYENAENVDIQPENIVNSENISGSINGEAANEKIGDVSVVNGHGTGYGNVTNVDGVENGIGKDESEKIDSIIETIQPKDNGTVEEVVQNGHQQGQEQQQEEQDQHDKDTIQSDPHLVGEAPSVPISAPAQEY